MRELVKTWGMRYNNIQLVMLVISMAALMQNVHALRHMRSMRSIVTMLDQR